MKRVSLVTLYTLRAKYEITIPTKAHLDLMRRFVRWVPEGLVICAMQDKFMNGGSPGDFCSRCQARFTVMEEQTNRLPTQSEALQRIFDDVW